MSIDNSNIVDAIGTEKDGSGITLTISDHLEWGSREHLLKLQEKLNTYLAFVESGEITTLTQVPKVKRYESLSRVSTIPMPKASRF